MKMEGAQNDSPGAAVKSASDIYKCLVSLEVL